MSTCGSGNSSDSTCALSLNDGQGTAADDGSPFAAKFAQAARMLPASISWSGLRVPGNGAFGRANRYWSSEECVAMGPPSRGTAVPFRVLVDREPPGDAHGLDVDEQGHGTLIQARLYQLIREPGPVTERTFEITFLAAGVESYAFTFG